MIGGALSSLLSFKLAGSPKPWIPKPITCISYASPLNGSSGFRTAFHQLEKDGLVRYLRVTNDKDFVPTVPPAFYKHVGIHLRLEEKRFSFRHPNTNGFMNALQNSLFKPVWNVLTYHGLELHEKRMETHKDTLQEMYLNDLYNDEGLMGKDFFGSDEL